MTMLKNHNHQPHMAGTNMVTHYFSRFDLGDLASSRPEIVPRRAEARGWQEDEGETLVKTKKISFKSRLGKF